MRILGLSGEKVVNYNLMYPVSPQNLVSLYGGVMVFDSSILFIKFHNYSKVHFNKKSFRIVKSKIEMIDIDFIKVNKTD